MFRRNAFELLSLASTVVLWEVFARVSTRGDSLPTLGRVLQALWSNHESLIRHSWPTTYISFFGLLAACFFAILFGIVFATCRHLERHLWGGLVALFAIPLITVVPLATSLFEENARVLLSTLAAFFPILENIRFGLNDYREDYEHLIRCHGGTYWDILMKVRMFACLPSLTSSLCAAFPLAILGTMLGELGGSRWGLGIFLQGAMTQGDPNLVGAICLVATLVSALGYTVFRNIGDHLASRYSEARGFKEFSSQGSPERLRSNSSLGFLRDLGVICLLWKLMTVALDQPWIVKGPDDVWKYLAGSAMVKSYEDGIASHILESTSFAIIGAVLGIVFAFTSALFVLYKPTAGKLLEFFSLTSQTIPMIALIGMIMVIVKSELVSMSLVVISVTFFPAFSCILQGLKTVPGEFETVILCHGGSSLQILSRVRLPAALPYVAIGARLVAPRALLGVVLAEFLVDPSSGVGGLLYKAKGLLDFGMICAICGAMALLSYFIYWLTTLAEKSLFLRFSSRSIPS